LILKLSSMKSGHSEGKMFGKNFFFIFFICLLLSLSGCGSKLVIKMITPEDSEKFAREFLHALRDGDFEKVMNRLNSGSIEPETEAKLKKASEQLNSGKIISMEVVNVKFTGTFMGTVKRSFISYEIKMDNKWMIANIVVEAPDNGDLSIIGIYVEPKEKSLAQINTFTLSGKTYPYYLMIVFSTLFSILTIYAFVICLISKIKSKVFWLWFIVLGVGNLTINWTTGQFESGIVSLAQLWLPAFRESLYGPWLVSVSLPAGAIIFLLIHGMKRKQPA